MSSFNENGFLRDVVQRACLDIAFKDEKMLPGVATIGALPIDITIKGGRLILNAVGDFGGTEKSFSLCQSRGKGLFRSLYPHFIDAMKAFDLEPRIWLTPLSPVWQKNYPLVEVEAGPGKGRRFFIDITQPLPPAPDRS